MNTSQLNWVEFFKVSDILSILLYFSYFLLVCSFTQYISTATKLIRGKRAKNNIIKWENIEIKQSFDDDDGTISLATTYSTLLN